MRHCLGWTVDIFQKSSEWVKAVEQLWSQCSNVTSIWSLKTSTLFIAWKHSMKNVGLDPHACGEEDSFIQSLASEFSLLTFAFSLKLMGSFTSYYGTRPELFMNGMLLSAWHYLENVGQLAGDEEFISDMCVLFLYCTAARLFSLPLALSVFEICYLVHVLWIRRFVIRPY